jgi:hypothetical protein
LSLNLLEPQGPVKACSGKALPFTFTHSIRLGTAQNRSRIFGNHNNFMESNRSSSKIHPTAQSLYRIRYPDSEGSKHAVTGIFVKSAALKRVVKFEAGTPREHATSFCCYFITPLIAFRDPYIIDYSYYNSVNERLIIYCALCATGSPKIMSVTLSTWRPGSMFGTCIDISCPPPNVLVSTHSTTFKIKNSEICPQRLVDFRTILPINNH